MTRRYACDRPDCEACDKAIGHAVRQRFDSFPRGVHVLPEVDLPPGYVPPSAAVGPPEPPSYLDRLDWPAAGTFDRLPRNPPESIPSPPPYSPGPMLEPAARRLRPFVRSDGRGCKLCGYSRGLHLWGQRP